MVLSCEHAWVYHYLNGDSMSIYPSLCIILKRNKLYYILEHYWKWYWLRNGGYSCPKMGYNDFKWNISWWEKFFPRYDQPSMHSRRAKKTVYEWIMSLEIVDMANNMSLNEFYVIRNHFVWLSSWFKSFFKQLHSVTMPIMIDMQKIFSIFSAKSASQVKIQQKKYAYEKPVRRMPNFGFVKKWGRGLKIFFFESG